MLTFAEKCVCGETVHAWYSSPIGVVEISGTADGIATIDFFDREPDANVATPDGLRDCVRQLDEYFHGRRKSFDLTVLLCGTEFQKQVWKKLAEIPYGVTVSYRQIAEGVGRNRSARAVGSANHRNQLAIVIPCHRVIGGNGKLAGYGGGVWRKEWLLKHEGVSLG